MQELALARDRPAAGQIVSEILDSTVPSCSKTSDTEHQNYPIAIPCGCSIGSYLLRGRVMVACKHPHTASTRELVVFCSVARETKIFDPRDFEDFTEPPVAAGAVFFY